MNRKIISFILVLMLFIGLVPPAFAYDVDAVDVYSIEPPPNKYGSFYVYVHTAPYITAYVFDTSDVYYSYKDTGSYDYLIFPSGTYVASYNFDPDREEVWEYQSRYSYSYIPVNNTKGELLVLYSNFDICDEDGNPLLSSGGGSVDSSAYPVEVPAPSPVEVSQVVDGLLTSSVSFYDSVACLVFDFGSDWQTVFEQSGSNLTITGRYNYLFVGSYNSDDDIIEDSAGNTGSGLFTYYPALDGLEVNTPYAWVSYNADTDSLDVISNSYNDSIDSTLTLSDCYLWGDPVGTYPYCFAFYHPDSAVALQWNGVSLLQNTNSISNFMWDYYDSVPPSDDSDDGQGDTNIYVDFTETNSILRSIKEIVHGISNSIVTLPEKIFDSFSEMLNIINDSITNGFTDIKSSIVSEFTALKDAIDNGFDSVIEAIQNQEINVEVDDDGKSVFDYILDALNPVASFFGALAGSALDGVIEAAEFASNIGSDVFDFLKNALLQILPIIALIASLGGWLVSLYGFLPPEFASFISVMVSILIVGILVKIALNVK